MTRRVSIYGSHNDQDSLTMQALLEEAGVRLVFRDIYRFPTAYVEVQHFTGDYRIPKAVIGRQVFDGLESLKAAIASGAFQQIIGGE